MEVWVIVDTIGSDILGVFSSEMEACELKAQIPAEDQEYAAMHTVELDQFRCPRGLSVYYYSMSLDNPVQVVKKDKNELDVRNFSEISEPAISLAAGDLEFYGVLIAKDEQTALESAKNKIDLFKERETDWKEQVQNQLTNTILYSVMRLNGLHSLLSQQDSMNTTMREQAHEEANEVLRDAAGAFELSDRLGGFDRTSVQTTLVKVANECGDLIWRTQ